MRVRLGRLHSDQNQSLRADVVLGQDLGQLDAGLHTP
jgi:hypothetical protein